MYSSNEDIDTDDVSMCSSDETDSSVEDKTCMLMKWSVIKVTDAQQIRKWQGFKIVSNNIDKNIHPSFER